MSMQWRTSLRSDSAPGSRTSSPVGAGPRPSARVHQREVDEFNREIRAQQESIAELTAALTAESEMALASNSATVADSPGSVASLNHDESLRVDSMEADLGSMPSSFPDRVEDIRIRQADSVAAKWTTAINHQECLSKIILERVSSE